MTCTSYDAYRKLVDDSLSSSCANALAAKVAGHRAQVPYYLIQSGVSCILQTVDSLGLSWHTLVHIRGFSRLRAGLVRLRALHGRRSEAKHQMCIFCGCGVRNATVHVLAVCRKWSNQRAAFVDAHTAYSSLPADKLALAILSCGPSQVGFIEAVELCGCVDQSASGYWRGVASDNC